MDVARLIGAFLLAISISIAATYSTASVALDDWKSLPTSVVTRIAFGSCAKQWEPQPIWSAIAETKPDVFLFLGDNIYGDWHGDEPFVPTAESLRADYERLAGIPEFDCPS